MQIQKMSAWKVQSIPVYFWKYNMSPFFFNQKALIWILWSVPEPLPALFPFKSMIPADCNGNQAVTTPGSPLHIQLRL